MEVPDLVRLVELAAVYPLQLLMVIVGLALVFGVVMPAVWSTRRTRRCAAAGVLDRLLTTVEVVVRWAPGSM